MPRAFTPKVVTANALLDGDVVYLTAKDSWSPDLSEAEFLEDETYANERLAAGAKRASEIVGAYLADMIAGPDGPEPNHFREEFRRTGPSNYFHGKQTEASDV